MLREHHDARVARRLVLHARADERCLRLEQRNSLTLHVRAHERTVRIVVLKERDHRRCNREHLSRRHVHIVDAVAVVQTRLLVETRRDALVDEELAVIERLVRLCDDELVLLVRRQIAHILRHATVLLVHAAIRRLHKAELVHARIVRKRADEADVRTFGGLDRAHAPVVRVVHVAHLESRALA